MASFSLPGLPAAERRLHCTHYFLWSTREARVLTLEDPIEYRLPQIRQTQVKEEIGLTFASGLRSLLVRIRTLFSLRDTR